MGGLVFNGSSPIRKEDIKPTLREFVREFTSVFPGTERYLEGVKTLGSAGHKAVSGDIDLALDEKAFKNPEEWGFDPEDIKALAAAFKKRARTASDAMLVKRAVITLLAKKLNEESELIKTDTKGSGNGTLFCQFPQFDENGEMIGKWVQVDINIGDVPWLEFAYHSESYQEDNIKGLHRTQLMLSLFVEKGYVFSHNYGVKDKETNKIVAKNPEQAIELLNKEYGFNLDQNTLANYHKLQEYLRNNLDTQELNKIYDRYLKILDSTRCDIPADLQNYWLDNQDRLGLTGKFLPSSSKLYAFREEE